MAIAAGDKAPEFELNDTGKNPVKLSDFAGKPVLIVFYPFTFTGICEGELCRIRDDYAQFEGAGVQVLAISCDPRPSQEKWKNEMGYQFPVLTDFWPHGEVAQAYGVFNEATGSAVRTSFLVGADGTVVDVIASGDMGTPREPERYTEALAKLG